MKHGKSLLEQLKPLPYIRKSVVYQLGRQLGLKDVSIDTCISRFLKSKEMYRLKNGLYVTVDFFDRNKSDLSYTFYLANIIRTPSYISSWSALQYYNLATEAVHAVTSVTLKVTKNYQTKVGAFTYQSIDKSFFSGFSLEGGRFDFFIASPSKALFDLLYFRTRQFRGFPRGKVHALVEELRIDLKEMSKGEQKKFYAMIKRYE